MQSLWNILGFRENPYFATPLTISREGVDLFVGRGAEIRRLLGKWDSSTGATTVIGGNIGTGKTSFLNVCQYLCLMGKREFDLAFDPPLIMPCVKTVQLEEKIEEHNLLGRFIRSAINSVRWSCSLLGEPVPPVVTETADWMDSLNQSESTSKGGGGTVLGVGGSATFSVSVAKRKLEDFSPDSLVDRLAALADSARLIRNYRGIVMAIDNIEMVDSDEVIKLLNKYRDTLFAMRSVWWVLIGQRGLYDLIDAEAPRVTQRIKGTETTLEGLSWDDFNLATQARLNFYRLRDDAVAPIGEELLRVLFDASSGEIRYVFKVADEIITDAIADDPKLRTIPPSQAERILQNSTKQQLGRLKLSDREKRVLRLICEKGSARPKDYKDYSIQNAPNFIQGYLQPLQEKGLLARSTQGNAATYAPRPLAILGSRFKLLG
ncbi:MAG TPA: hypothetical protein VFZ09_49265 [Archangium sp.]|uniref:hypothetical protein n=1 Tax=Archangium sp. TaxID=1872627 RepID=UPI002E36C563|nr:hypothetical protein [Archangium sp.]HEX5754271.1 hypothetical protein [Archangium sp.]